MKQAFAINIQPQPARPVHRVRAFLLTGPRPEEWLNTLTLIGRNTSEVQCFAIALPQRAPYGLFVIAATPVDNSNLLEPFNEVGPGVFIPVSSTLKPPVRAEEWRQLFRWDVHFFHPIFGFWGFQHQDAVQWEHYLPDIVLYRDWSAAQPPTPERLPLSKIQVLMPPSRAVFGESGDMPGSKPLSDIPNGPGNSFWDRMKKNFGEAGKDGTDKSFMDRLGDTLRPDSQLDKQRESQLNRLLEMFKENMAEALKYAIPVDSPYAHRGTSNSGGTLTPGSTNFDLSRLGGGQSASFWKADPSLYMKLRRQYEEAARIAQSNGDFRLAAYIYAHLLGDYTLAAQTLRQGGFYREAAVLYSEHMNNPTAAAECLEAGGFLAEAVEIYEKKGDKTKCAQLYRAIGNEEKSRYYWNLLAEEAIEARQHETAGKIYEKELNDMEKALQVYLTGWRSEKENASGCLGLYIQLQGRENSTELANHLEPLLNEIPTAVRKKQYVVELQNQMKTFYRTPAVLDAARKTVLSYLQQQDNDWELNRLLAFFKNDRLLKDDIQRFIHAPRTPLKTQQAKSQLLITQANWAYAIFHQNHIFILGERSGNLILYMTNWSADHYGRESYLGKINADVPLRLFAFPSNNTILYSAKVDALHVEINLDGQNYLISSPEWIDTAVIAAGWGDAERFMLLSSLRDNMVLHFFGPGLDFLHRVTLQTSERMILRASQFVFGQYHKLCYTNGYFFTHLGSELLRISEHGITEWISFEHDIDDIALNRRGITAELIIVGLFGIAIIARPWSENIFKAVVPVVLFSRDEPLRVRILQDKYAFIFSGQQGKMFDISSGSLQSGRLHHFSSPVIDAFPGPDYRRWAVLLQNGTVQLLDYEEEKTNKYSPFYGSMLSSSDDWIST